MEKNRINDIQFRKVISETKETATSSLKYRIMQQIVTEKALTRKKSTNSYSFKSAMLSVFGLMYVVIAIVGIVIYYLGGRDSLESIYTVLFLIVSVFSMFWMISVLDEKRRCDMKAKQKK